MSYPVIILQRYDLVNIIRIGDSANIYCISPLGAPHNAFGRPSSAALLTKIVEVQNVQLLPGQQMSFNYQIVLQTKSSVVKLCVFSSNIPHQDAASAILTFVPGLEIMYSGKIECSRSTSTQEPKHKWDSVTANKFGVTVTPQNNDDAARTAACSWFGLDPNSVHQ